MNSERQILISRLADLAEQAARQGRATATVFLTPAEQAMAEPFLHNRSIPFSFAGGYDVAERCRCLFWAEANDPPDLADFLAITAIRPAQSGLGHRDYLGSLLALGLRRDQLGDILVQADQAYVVHMPSLTAFFLTQLNRVGGSTAVCRQADFTEIAALPAAVPLHLTASVSSLRVDAVLGTVFHHSRSQSLELIRRGLVQVDWLECLKPDQLMAAGQVLTVRGSGRARLLKCREQTRKGRIRLVYEVFTSP